MADKFDEFLEEVENDIRQERLMNLWQRYGKHLTTAVSVILVAVIGFSAWQSYDNNKRQKSAERFLHAQELLSQGQVDQAITDLTMLAKEGSAIYPILAQLNRAAALGKPGPTQNVEEAVRMYEEISGNAQLEPAWRDLALVLAVALQADRADVSEIPGLLDKLKPLTDSDNPWHAFASELQGALLHHQGNSSAALEVFSNLVRDKKTPDGIMVRSQLMSQILSGESSEDPAVELDHDETVTED